MSQRYSAKDALPSLGMLASGALFVMACLFGLWSWGTAEADASEREAEKISIYGNRKIDEFQTTYRENDDHRPSFNWAAVTLKPGKNWDGSQYVYSGTIKINRRLPIKSINVVKTINVLKHWMEKDKKLKMISWRPKIDEENGKVFNRNKTPPLVREISFTAIDADN